MSVTRWALYHTANKQLFQRCCHDKRHHAKSLSMKMIRLLHVENQQSSTLIDYIHNKITATGPISVAEYMKLTLAFPNSGYYMKRDVFGVDGDFVTSPELSQMFGELVAAWFISEWINLGSPSAVQLVELGPGRGTLAGDILRTFRHLNHVLKDTTFSFHFVEMSPVLANIQHELLCQKPLQDKITIASETLDTYYMSGKTPNNIDLFWHKVLDTVPQGKFTLFVAHEFFDALPIHKFVKQNEQWKEVYVDSCREEAPKKLRFILLPQPTLASQTLISKNETRQHVEISPESNLILQSIASRIGESNGAALIGDYGHLGDKEDTLRAFKQHKLADVLTDVGNCDITADVDFKYLQSATKDFNVDICGPITQHKFLKNMGIDTRLMMLLRNNCDKDVQRKLIGSYDIMVNPEKMGERFKFLSITSKNRVKSKNDQVIPVTALGKF